MSYTSKVASPCTSKLLPTALYVPRNDTEFHFTAQPTIALLHVANPEIAKTGARMHGYGMRVAT